MNKFVLAAGLLILSSTVRAGEAGTDWSFPEKELFGVGPEATPADPPAMDQDEWGHIPSIQQPPPPPPPPPPRAKPTPPKAKAQKAPAAELHRQADEIARKVDQIRSDRWTLHRLLSLLVAAVFPEQMAAIYAANELYNAFQETKDDIEKERHWWTNLLARELGGGSTESLADNLKEALRNGDFILSNELPNIALPNDIKNAQRQLSDVSQFITPGLLRIAKSFGPIWVRNNCGFDIKYALVFQRPGGVWVIRSWQDLKKDFGGFLKAGEIVTNNPGFYVFARWNNRDGVFGLENDPQSRQFHVGSEYLRFAYRLGLPGIVQGSTNFMVSVCEPS
ncbi:hypothetical protein NKI41_13555 [Mesorhizobium sp. M0601]|uniref:hypothetical protein n=1 Tax=Mesorhizobium sp. M0601 TaxID=2956969 RepID=UPI00333975B7